MSKSKWNYPDPQILIDEVGSDLIWLYLMNSPLVKGQDLKFSKTDLLKIKKEIFLPWYYLCKLLL